MTNNNKWRNFWFEWIPPTRSLIGFKGPQGYEKFRWDRLNFVLLILLFILVFSILIF